jgi:sigma-B regulation protein RsbU (phosphoserine phosphatase)
VKILLVDDDRIVRAIHSRLLTMQGHDVVETTDGESAWEILKSGEISFVVSDWMMPNLSGVDLCRRIRAAKFEHYVYVILCTSRAEKSDLVEGMDAGADDFIGKPIGSEELRVRVRAGERILSLQHGLTQKNRELEGINNNLRSAHKLIEDDLKAAAWMQQNLLPPHALEAHGVRCEWRLEPSSYVAGDTFNLFAMNAHQVCLYLLDVSGHGVPAAMLSVTLSSLLTADASHGNPLRRYDKDRGTFDPLSPGDAIRELNRRFQSKDDHYFTMIYGLFDSRSSVLSLAQAGHPSPILMRKECMRPQLLGGGGMPIGVFPDIHVDCIDVQVSQGDRVLLYSDGITECMNDRNEEYGESRLLDHLEDRKSRPLNELLAGLLDEVKAWRGSQEAVDDLSLMAIEIS